MKKLTFVLSVLFLLNFSVKAQLQIVSSSPADGQVNVSTSDTVKVTFSSPIDTSYRFHDFDRLVTNIAPDPTISFSSDLKTVYITDPLMPNTDYYLIFYYVRAMDGSVLDPPVKIEFTTASSFSGVTVSGKVTTTDSSLVDNAYAIVGLSLNDPKMNKPMLFYMTVADSNGNYSIPHVKNGIYYPLAVQDVDKNGVVDPDSNDFIVFADSIHVNGSNITNLDFVFNPSTHGIPVNGLKLVGSSPANGATGVATSSVISFTFNMPLDTSFVFKEGGNIVTNLGEIRNYHYSSDFKTVFFDTTLQANRDYYVLFYSLRAVGGAMLGKPAIVHFTTKSAFAGYNVQGEVTSSIPQLSPSFSIVGLFDTPPDSADFPVYLTVADSNGNFVIPNVSSGFYYPFAIKDINMDGLLNPDHGIDPAALVPPITVNNSDFNGLIINFSNHIPVMQLSVLNTYPQNNAVNFGLGDTVKITFSEPIDTAYNFNEGSRIITNMGKSMQISFNDSLTTMKIYAPLQANKDYFVLLWGIKGMYGGRLYKPFLLNFTTASSFDSNVVSGKVISDDGSKSVAFQVVGLAQKPLGIGEPLFDYFTLTDSMGNFKFDHVRNGTYYPIAAIDGNHDGDINPQNGVDAIGTADSIVVNNNDITNIEIHLQQMKPVPFKSALAIADSLRQKSLPSDANLVIVQGDSPDSSGNVWGWNFKYFSPSSKQAFEIYVDWFNNNGQVQSVTDSNEFNWLSSIKPIGDSVFSAADPFNFIKHAFTLEFQKMTGWPNPQHDTINIDIRITLGELRQTEFWQDVPDSNFYWGISFTYFVGYDPWDPNNIVKANRYIADYKTGTLIKQTAVKDNNGAVPKKFALYQNYPNPFNPTTNIKFDIAKTGLYKIVIYNILGQKVVTLLNRRLTPGSYKVTFNAVNLPTGVYIYRLEGETMAITKKLLLLK